MDAKFLPEAEDFLRRYGLINKNDWYLHKIEELEDEKSVVVLEHYNATIHMMELNGELVFFTRYDAEMAKQSSGDSVYFASLFFFDRKLFVSDEEIEEMARKMKESDERFLAENPWENVKSLADLLGHLKLIPSRQGQMRKKFYSFLREAELADEMRRPTDKAIKMGYSVLVEEIEPWYEWKVEFIYSLLGWSEKHAAEWLSRTKMYRQCGIKYERLCSVLEPYSSSSDFYDPKPNSEAIERGFARVCRCFEWHPECVKKICRYFIRLEGTAKSEKITLDEAKSHVSWMGVKGMAPGEESSMSLLSEVDPECFERINSIQTI